MEHEHAAAEPPGANLESRAMAGERIGALGPFAHLVGGEIVLAVIEDDLEQPIARRARLAVAVVDSLEVAIGIRGLSEAVSLLGAARVDASIVLRLVVVADDVALVVARLLE